MKTVSIFKLLTGEIVMATVVDENEEVIALENAFQVNFLPIQDSVHAQVQFLQWMPCQNKNNGVMYKTAIAGQCEPDDDIFKYYKSTIKMIQKENDEEFEVDFTPDKDADYKEEEFISGNQKDIKKKDIHPLLRTLKSKKDTVKN